MQRATFISRHRSVSLAGRCCGLPRRGGNRRAENGFADSNLMRFHSQLTGPYTRLTWINGANDYPATLCAIPGRIYICPQNSSLHACKPDRISLLMSFCRYSASYLGERPVENCTKLCEIGSLLSGENYYFQGKLKLRASFNLSIELEPFDSKAKFKLRAHGNKTSSSLHSLVELLC